MFTPTRAQIENIRTTLQDILEGGDEAFAKAWIVWAELQLHTLGHPNKSILVEKMMPLVMACAVFNNNKPIEEIQTILHDSVVRFLFQAKLDGRNSLEMIDARKAISYVKTECQK